MDIVSVEFIPDGSVCPGLRSPLATSQEPGWHGESQRKTRDRPSWAWDRS